MQHGGDVDLTKYYKCNGDLMCKFHLHEVRQSCTKIHGRFSGLDHVAKLVPISRFRVLLR